MCLILTVKSVINKINSFVRVNNTWNSNVTLHNLLASALYKNLNCAPNF